MKFPGSCKSIHLFAAQDVFVTKEFHIRKPRLVSSSDPSFAEHLTRNQTSFKPPSSTTLKMATKVGEPPVISDPAEAPLDKASSTLRNIDTSNMTPDQKQEIARAQGQVDGGKDKKPESLKISISLDLDVEVHLTARIKGDIVIGLL